MVMPILSGLIISGGVRSDTATLPPAVAAHFVTNQNLSVTDGEGNPVALLAVQNIDQLTLVPVEEFRRVMLDGNPPRDPGIDTCVY
jgi:hypothetical protein